VNSLLSPDYPGSDNQDSDKQDLSFKDRVLLLTLTGIWLICLVFHTNMVFGEGDYLPAFIPAFDRSVDGTPVVVSLVADREHGGNALFIGDRLITMNDEPLEGITPIRFQFLFADYFSSGPIDLLIERDGVEIPLSIEASNTKISWSHLPPVIGYAAIALIVLLRAPGVRGSRLFFAGFMSLAIFQTVVGSGSGYLVVGGRLWFILMGSISLYLLLLWLISFPRPAKELDEKRRVPNWVALIVPVLFPLPRLNYYVNGPLSPEDYVLQTYMIDALFTLLVIAILGWNYWCVDGANRRKVRWVLFGVYAAFVPIALVQFTGAMFELGDWFFWIQSIVKLFYVAVPLSLFMAMRHFNLFDVDRVISGSVWYTAMIVLSALAAEALFEPIAASMATYLGAEGDTGQLIFVAVLAALALPAQAYLRPKIEGFFFPNRKNLSDSIEQLIDEVANTNTEDLEQVALIIGSRISMALELEDCAIYLFEDGEWVPVFRFGDKIKLNLGANESDELKQLLDGRLLPIRLKQANAKEATYASLFRGVDAELIIPFQSTNDSNGFICLGRKHSKDVFTNNDVALLAGVAVQVSMSLA
jgi:hypothetical protein